MPKPRPRRRAFSRFLAARAPSARAMPGLILALWLLLASGTVPAAAADPVALPQGPLPAEELKPVEFSYLTIECTITGSNGGLAVEMRTRTRLKNPEKKTSFERHVTFPGLPVADVKIGTQTDGLRPAEGAEPWLLQVRPDGDAVIEGTQRLSTNGPLTELQFDWGALKPWGSPLGAVRLTMRFPDRLYSEQLLAVDPAPTERDTLQLTWSYERLQPQGKVQVLLIAPQYWRAVRQAREATSGDRATVAGYLALAAALRPLAEAEGMPPGVVAAMQAERLSALRRAVTLDPLDPRAHDELAAYLRAQAGGEPALLAEAATEMKAAYDLAPGDAGIKQRLLSALDELMAACRQVGDTRGLLAALDVVEAVAPQGSQERAAAYADLIAGLLDEGRVNEAEATIVAGFGQQALDRFAPYRPRFAAVSADIETHVGRRIMHFTLMPARGMEAAAEREVAGLVDALSRTGSAEVRRAAENGRMLVEVAVPFADSTALRAASLGLAGALPAEADPALLLVRAVIAPQSLEFHARQELQSDRLLYAESADLSQPEEALARLREELRPARLEAETPTDDPLEAARRRWTLALLSRYEADWQALARGCQVTYRVLPPENIVAPHWTLTWGEERSLIWSTRVPHLERLVPYGVGACLVVVAIFAGVLFWRRRRRALELPHATPDA